MSTSLQTDLRLLRTAVGKVKLTAQLESKEMDSAMEARSAGAMSSLHEAHLNELDAVQMLVAVMELVERRHPQFFANPTSIR